MEALFNLGLAVAGFCLLAFLVITGITTVSVYGLKPGIVIAKLPDEEPYPMAAYLREHGPWATEQGFDRYLGTFVVRLPAGACLIAAWQHRLRPTYFCPYAAANKVFHDFVTLFSENRSLTTTNTRDGQFLPKAPGRYMQTFTGLSLDELLNRHAASEQFLLTQGRILERPVSWTFEEALSASLASQGAYIRSLPLWPLRAVYWFLVRKRRLHNKTIEEQHQLGLIRLPHELGFQEFSPSS